MNILCCCDIIFETCRGGSARMVSEITNRLSKRGHKIYVITKRGSYDASFKENRKIYFYPTNKYLPILSRLSIKSILDEILNKSKIDIVYCHHPFTTFLLLLDHRLDNLPKVCHYYSPWHIEYQIRVKNRLFKQLGSTFRKKIEMWVLNRSDRIIVLSEYMKGLLKKEHNVNRNISIIPGGVDVEKFSPADDKLKLRKKLNIPVDKFVILTVRELTERMGIENLIIAMKKITEKRKDAFLIIGGAGELENKLKKLTDELSLRKCVRFVGTIPDEILPDYYRSSDLFALPTISLEGFGLVTIESFSCGLPVIGTPVGATPELLSSFELLFESPDPPCISKKILDFMHLSSEARKKLSEECRKYAMKYSWDRIVDEVEKILSEVAYG